MSSKRLSRAARQELLTALKDCYARATKIGKGAILDEFVALTGHNRSFASRLLGASFPAEAKPPAQSRTRIYGEAASGIPHHPYAMRPIASQGKRLNAILPSLIESLERARTSGPGSGTGGHAALYQSGVDRSDRKTGA